MTLRTVLEPRRIAFALALIAGACGAAFIVYGITARPYAVVEAEMIFEASRVQQGFPLYVDPAVGAWEMGPPPSRYDVLYTPLWPWIVAHLGPTSLVGMRTAARALEAAALFGVLGALVAFAERRNRLAAATGALLMLGLHLLAREGGLATADVLAATLSALGLLRMTKKRALDGLSAALLAAAPLVKPSVVGGPIGALVAHVVMARRAGPKRLLLPLAAGGVVAGSLIAGFHVWSAGAWLEHVVRGTGQPLSLDRWVEEFLGRAVFLGAPHAVVCAIAVRRRAVLAATLPLATSIAWAAFAMAKHGSATNYWLEPTLLAVVTLGAMPERGASTRPVIAHVVAWAGVAFAGLVAATSLPVFARARSDYEAWRAFLGDVDRACPREPGEVVMASDARLELELNGRIIIPAWQNAYAVRRGQFPLDAWRKDLARKEVRWFVHTRDWLDPVPEHIEGLTEVSAYRRELRDAVEESFVLDREMGALIVFRRRPEAREAP